MPAEPKVLIVEDDKKISELLSDYLKQAGFNVSALNRGDTVIHEVRRNPPDLIILDIMLPGKDGMTICGEVRTFSKVPILILTAKGEEIDRILGLELGADDYVCKPFSPREVVTRIKAILRRTCSEPTGSGLVAGPITINPDEHHATVWGKTLHLTPNEFKLLKLMVSHPNKVFTRMDFVSNLQGYNGSERIIDKHIKNIREKMDEIQPGNNLIQTVYGIGYLLNAPHPAYISSGRKVLTFIG